MPAFQLRNLTDLCMQGCKKNFDGTPSQDAEAASQPSTMKEDGEFAFAFLTGTWEDWWPEFEKKVGAYAWDKHHINNLTVVDEIINAYIEKLQKNKDWDVRNKIDEKVLES